MYFYEVIKECDEELLVREFLFLCDNSPDIKHTEKAIRNALMSIREMKAKTSDKKVIIIEKVISDEIFDGEFDRVYVLDTSDNKTYGLEINPWSDTLGYKVDDNNLFFYGYEKFAALVLWEITWFGYDEVTIQERVRAWNKN